jgi:hypothetical protein
MGNIEITDEVRSIGRSLIDRLATDDDFLFAFDADPPGVMVAAGVPPALVDDLFVALLSLGDADVEGFAMLPAMDGALTGMCLANLASGGCKTMLRASVGCCTNLCGTGGTFTPSPGTGGCNIGSWYR